MANLLYIYSDIYIILEWDKVDNIEEFCIILYAIIQLELGK